MIDVSKLKLTLAQVLGSEKLILLALNERTLFEDRKPTDKKIMVATVTAAESLFEKVDVKVDSVIGLSITNEMIAERVKNLDFVYVNFSSDEVKVYRDYSSGQDRVTAKAKEMTLADETSINLN